MVAKKYQNPEGGLNAAGRAYFKRKEGSNLQAPVGDTPAAGSKRMGRKVSFRKALALKKWGFGSVEAARNFARRHRQS